MTSAPGGSPAGMRAGSLGLTFGKSFIPSGLSRRGPADYEDQALRDVTEWLDKLVRTGMPELVDIRPRSDHPLHHRVLASHERIVAILGRIASDIDELARARCVADLPTEANDADPRLRIRRRLAEPSIEMPRHGSSNKQWREAVEWFFDEHRRAGLPPPWGGRRPWDTS